MKGRFFLDIIVRQSPTVLKLFASKNQALLVRRDAFLVLNLALHIVDRIGRLNFECDCFTSDYHIILIPGSIHDRTVEDLRVLTKICMMCLLYLSLN